MRALGRIGRGAFVGLAAAAMAIAGTGVATAGEDGPYVETPNGCASAWFQANGDKFWIGDWCDDKASGAVSWRVNLPCTPDGAPCPVAFLYNSKGADTGQDVGIDWKEEVPISYRACVIDRSAEEIKECSGYAGAVT